MEQSKNDAEALRENRQELAFLQCIARRLPEDTQLLRAMADLHTRIGDIKEGLRLDERLSRLCADDPLVWYNLGCSLSLSGRNEEALEALSRSIELGYDDYEWMKKDSDLSELHGDPRFESMLEWVYNTFAPLSEGGKEPF